MKQFPLNIKRRLQLIWFLLLVYLTAAIVIVVASLGLELPTFKLAVSQHALMELITPAPQPGTSIAPPPSGETTRPAAPEPTSTDLPAIIRVPRQAAIPSRFQGRIVRQVSVNNRKVVALTFDDGPWPITPKFLEVLQQQKVRATFFMIGRHIKKFPEIARQVAIAGHALGNHSWSHRFTNISAQDVIAEVENTSFLINKITGIKTDMFRPPGGFLDNGMAEYAAHKKYLTALWTVDPHDTKSGMTTKAIIENVLQHTKPGSVILLHDGGGPRQATLQALPQILAGLKAKGYEFVTLPELLQMQVQSIPVAAPGVAPSPKPTPPTAVRPATPALKPTPLSTQPN